MLRVSTLETDPSAIGVSSGTAGVLGLRPLHQEHPPTTAYLMIGERCRSNCSFCAQASGSTAGSRFLSRITWPLYPSPDVLSAVAEAFRHQKIGRCCFQVTSSPGYQRRTLAAVRTLAGLSAVPICVSTSAPHAAAVRALLEAGAERVTVALDAASERTYRATKTGAWGTKLRLLQQCATTFPGRIGTHLIVGLGESERDMVTTLQLMVDWGITVGLFCFTPVAGTAMAHRSPPSLSSYRRIQAAFHLITSRFCRMDNLGFSPDGRIVEWGLDLGALRARLSDGVAFRTAGCPGCNRPYYNERPGGTMYNYPRALTNEETNDAIDMVLMVPNKRPSASLTCTTIVCSP